MVYYTNQLSQSAIGFLKCQWQHENSRWWNSNHAQTYTRFNTKIYHDKSQWQLVSRWEFWWHQIGLSPVFIIAKWSDSFPIRGSAKWSSIFKWGAFFKAQSAENEVLFKIFCKLTEPNWEQFSWTGQNSTQRYPWFWCDYEIVRIPIKFTIK